MHEVNELQFWKEQSQTWEEKYREQKHLAQTYKSIIHDLLHHDQDTINKQKEKLRELDRDLL